MAILYTKTYNGQVINITDDVECSYKENYANEARTQYVLESSGMCQGMGTYWQEPWTDPFSSDVLFSDGGSSISSSNLWPKALYFTTNASGEPNTLLLCVAGNNWTNSLLFNDTARYDHLPGTNMWNPANSSNMQCTYSTNVPIFETQEEAEAYCAETSESERQRMIKELAVNYKKPDVIDQVDVNDTLYDLGATARNISFNNSKSDLTSTNVQNAITEVDSKIDNLATVATSGDYDDLINKPSIPANTSDLNNDAGFIDSSVDTLTNYYTKNQTDGKYMIKGVDYVTAGQASGSTLGTKATAEGNEVIPAGDYSHAEGSFTSAMGDYSHVEGRYTFAGNYAHSEGQFSSGAGSYSHAEGQYTFAGGSSAHAEGDRTSALGSYSHAEGNGTSAASVADHAEGQETSAYNYSHAEGNNTYAYGNSHAEGLTTTAGSYSHAEGSSTCAVGDSSHAEGNYTVARNPYAHAEGQGTSAFGESSHAEGYHTYTNGTQGNHAEGVNSSATGFISHAEGRGTLASGNQSHAEGNGTTAHTNSHAEGSYTYANSYSHAEGGNTNAIGDYSHAEGYYTTASEDYSHASGYKTCASGIGAHAEGGYTTASVTVTNVASGASSHAEGGCGSIGQNSPTIAIGNSSHAEGTNTYAYGASTHAEGYKSSAYGMQSHAEGQYTYAIGKGAHTEGQYTTASGICSHSEGASTQAYGIASHAEGYNTTSYDKCSHSEGAYTCAVGEYQHVEGKYNVADSTMAHIIGNGTSTTRSNAFTVSWDGDVTAGRSNGLTNDNKLPTGADVNNYIHDVFSDHTVTGNPITFDAFTGLEITNECKVTMNPIQDLHGYEYPWVGGAGKNKFSCVDHLNPSANLSATKNADGSVRIYGTPNSTWAAVSDLTDCDLPAGQYTFSIQSAVAYNIYTQCYVGGTNTNRAINTGQTYITFTVSGTITQIRLMISGMTVNTPVDVTIKPMLASGTDTVFEPYSNICPISGRTEASVTNKGNNYFDKTAIISGKRFSNATGSAYNSATDTVSESGFFISELIEVSQGQVLLKNSPLEDAYHRWHIYNSSKVCVRYTSDNSITIGSGEAYVAICGRSAEVDTTEVNKPTTYTHQYSETIYGGVDDFVNGELQNELRIVSENDFTSVSSGATPNGYHWTDINIGYTPAVNMSNMLPNKNGDSGWGSSVPCFGYVTSGTYKYMRVYCAESTLADFKTAYAGLQIVFSRETPDTISTSAEEITLLKGNNVLSTNADNMELKYSADIKTYIDKAIQTNITDVLNASY